MRLTTRMFWFGVAPLILCAVALRTLMPDFSQARGNESLLKLASIYERFDLAFAVAFFVTATLVINHWRHVLPGGRHLGQKARPSGTKRTVLLFAGLLLVSTAAFLVRARMVELHRVTSASMLPTILPSDRIVTEKFAYRSAISGTDATARPPARGEVIVFPASTAMPQHSHLVKRVLGIPGDTIEVHRGSVLINDWKVPSCNAGSFVDAVQDRLIVGRISVEFLGDESYLTIKVPEDGLESKYNVLPGEVFVMGDNRGFSEDSRIWMHGRDGGVQIENIEGRVTRVLFGRDGTGRLNASRFWQTLGTSMPTSHIDTKALTAGIEGCLKIRPKITLPPAPASLLRG